MVNISNYNDIKKSIPENVLLLAVSKTKPEDDIMGFYNIGQRDFGETTHWRWHQNSTICPKISIGIL